MNRFQIYSTGGTLEKTLVGPHTTDCDIIQRLGVSPPWQLGYLDGHNRELICLFSAKLREPGTATRVNNYYARLQTDDDPTDLFVVLSEHIDSLFRDKFDPDSDEAVHEEWCRAAEGEANPKWISQLADEYSVPDEYRSTLAAVRHHLQQGEGSLGFGFNSTEMAYTLMQEAAIAETTAVLGNPVKQDEFNDTKLLVEIDEGHDDFTPFDADSRSVFDSSREAHEREIIEATTAAFETGIDEYLTKRRDTSGASMEALHILHGLRSNLGGASEPFEPKDNQQQQILEGIIATVDEQLDGTSADRGHAELTSELTVACTERIERIQKRLADQTIEYIDIHLDELNQKQIDNNRVAATIATLKDAYTAGGHQRKDGAVDDALDEMLATEKAKSYLTSEQWEWVSDDIVSMLEDELEQVNSKRIAAAADSIESNIDDCVSNIASNTHLSEQDVRIELEQQVTIASPQMVTENASAPAWRRPKRNPLSSPTWKRFASAPVQSWPRIVITALIITLVLSTAVFFYI